MSNHVGTSTVVFLHGLGTVSGMWHEHAKLLPEFVCLFPDLPGHGTAAGRPWRSIADTASEIATLIEATPEHRAHVVGLSLGGAVAVELMNTRPELLDRVVIDGASGVPWRFSPILVAAAVLVAPFVHTLPFMRLVAAALAIPADRRAGFYREFRLVDRASFRRAVRDALCARLRNVAYPRPVLFIAGARDVGGVRASNRAVARLLPDARAVYLPHSWHAWVGTNPDLHRAAIRAFLLGDPLPRGLADDAATSPRA